MATGVKPRDEDINLTRSDLDALQDAMKNKKFRDLLNDYCEEIRDPANQALYQKEMVQLEKERGYDIKFVNPKGGYVIKTSVAGDRKAFINICSNDNVGKPSFKVQQKDGKKGMDWKIPYSMIQPREDYDHKRERCVIYDVVFHPDTLRMAEVNKQFRELVNKTAFEGLEKSYNIHLDSNNYRFPKSFYKGMSVPAVIRKEDPNYQPPGDDDTEALTPEMIEKLYPQHTYNKPSEELNKKDDETQEQGKKQDQIRKHRRGKEEFTHKTDEGYTIPKYVIKQQRNVDLQEFTFHRDSKQHSAIPSQIVVEISLPLLSSTKDCVLDVKEKSLALISEKPAKYKLSILLPYLVNDECGSAKFDKSKRKLIVTLPVIRKNMTSEINSKVDSGVESEENSESHSDEDQPHSNLVEELSSSSNEPSPLPSVDVSPYDELDTFFDKSLGYILPPFTHNVLDDVIAFTFHVKNTEPDSVQVKNNNNNIYVRFTSVGSGFVPVHYAAILTFDDDIKFENVSGEAWDNNVILQLELAGDIPEKFQIGLNSESMTNEYFDMSHVKKTCKAPESVSPSEETAARVVEVTNFGNETNIVVSSNTNDYDEDDDESPSPNEREIVWTESSCDNGAKSILRKPMTMMRSYSESSAGDVASSMDYISSDCIPEESSYKKTVRFNDVISKQFYRYNSSIEGQKKKNQRKKSKKRNSERRKSESEAEDDSINNTQAPKPRVKSALKQRRDSGLADTSDAEADCKNTPDERSFHHNNNDNVSNGHSTQSMLNIVDKNVEDDDESAEIWETKTEKVKNKKSDNITCENIKHNTDFYNPDKLNKGQYQEVTFKNDLIFDLDM